MAGGETFGEGLAENPVENEKEKKEGPRYWAKPVKSRDSSAVRGPDKDGKEHQVCQVGFYTIKESSPIQCSQSDPKCYQSNQIQSNGSQSNSN